MVENSSICWCDWYRLGEASLVEQYDHAIRARAQVISFDPPVTWRYATLRSTHAIRNPDAIQLACAAHIGGDLFITNDSRLHKLDLPVIGLIAPLEKFPL